MLVNKRVQVVVLAIVQVQNLPPGVHPLVAQKQLVPVHKRTAILKVVITESIMCLEVHIIVEQQM